jgi:hypothetical protein
VEVRVCVVVAREVVMLPYQTVVFANDDLLASKHVAFACATPALVTVWKRVVFTATIESMSTVFVSKRCNVVTRVAMSEYVGVGGGGNVN